MIASIIVQKRGPSSWFFFSVACLIALPVAVSGQARDVVGRWESVERSSGGLGSMLTFFDDGTVAYSGGAVVDMPYRLDGTELVMGDGPRIEVTIVGDTLIQGRSDESMRSLRVRGPLPGEHAITGAWSTLGVSRFMTFEADMLYLRIPFSVDRGTYTWDGDSLIIVLNLEGREVRWHGFLRDATLEFVDERLELRRALAYFELGSASPAPGDALPGQLNNKFAALWSNIDPDTRGLTQLLISQSAGEWHIQAWGQCQPQDCDWGEVDLRLIGASVEDTSFDYAFASWEPSHAVTHLIMRIDGDELTVEAFTLFRDSSSRSNFRTVYRLSRTP